MVQRTKRRDDLSQSMKEQYLQSLCEARRTAIDMLTQLTPFGEEYIHMRKLTRFIDEHQGHYTGNREHFWIGAPATTLKVVEPQNDT